MERSPHLGPPSPEVRGRQGEGEGTPRLTPAGAGAEGRVGGTKEAPRDEPPAALASRLASIQKSSSPFASRLPGRGILSTMLLQCLIFSYIGLRRERFAV